MYRITVIDVSPNFESCVAINQTVYTAHQNWKEKVNGGFLKKNKREDINKIICVSCLN